MKQIAVALLAALGSAWCGAQEYGRVVSSTPVVQQFQVPRQVCSQETWQAPAQKSGAGGVFGALAGGVVGNSIGQGSGRAAATALGIMGGALLGDRLEGAGETQAQQVQRCTTQTLVESRVVGYQVVYEYAGKQFSVQMPQDPGPQVQLQITPVGSLPPAPPPVAYATPPAVVYATPPTVVVATPATITSTTYWYPAYQPYAYRPRVGIDLRFGNGGGHHRHWR
jgi:uncharacterized protein YcfJ